MFSQHLTSHHHTTPVSQVMDSYIIALYAICYISRTPWPGARPVTRGHVRPGRPRRPVAINALTGHSLDSLLSRAQPGPLDCTHVSSRSSVCQRTGLTHHRVELLAAGRCVVQVSRSSYHTHTHTQVTWSHMTADYELHSDTQSVTQLAVTPSHQSQLTQQATPLSLSSSSMCSTLVHT